MRSYDDLDTDCIVGSAYDSKRGKKKYLPDKEKEKFKRGKKHHHYSRSFPYNMMFTSR